VKEGAAVSSPADAGSGGLFACDGRVDEEKLRELLKVQVELPNLDYKQQYDFNRGTKSRLDFVKDCAAMMSLPDGGYLVVGVDEYGKSQPAAGISRQSYDETRLRDILRDFLGTQIDLRCQAHVIDGELVAVVYLGPKPDGLFPVMDKEGTYNGSTGQQIHFREGDVFTRDGTMTRRWHNSDLPQMLSRYADHVRQQEQARLAPVIEQIRVEMAGGNLASAPLGAVSWNLPEAQFDVAVLELIRAGDMIGFKKLSFDIAADGMRLLAESGEDDQLEQLLDRIASILGTAILFDQPDYLQAPLDALHRIYMPRPQLPNSAAKAALRRDIAARVLAVLGLVVRRSRWWALDLLVRRPIDTYYKSWLRHALTMASRAGVLVNDNGQEFGGALISFARWHAERIPALHIDVGVGGAAFLPGAEPEREDALLDSICQADFLACVDLQLHDADYYPSFAEYYAHRTWPIIDVLAEDTRLQAALSAEGLGSIARAVTAVTKRLEFGNQFRFDFDHHNWQRHLEPHHLWAP
jgi:hypothetical protein